jgi:osmoprotectant transport system permease protein
VAPSQLAQAQSQEAPNPWISVDFVRDNSEAILAALRQHITLTVVSVALGLLLAVPLALLARRYGWLRTPLLGAAGLLYTIPSLALFAVLAPVTGLTATTVVLGLTSYTLLVLVRNVLAGLDGVPADVVEAARGMGMGPGRLLLRVELPLALPSIVTGLRIATVSTIALTTVGITVGSGGLGDLIYGGFVRNDFHAQIGTGLALVVALALLAEVVLLAAQRVLTPWTRA